MSMTTVDLIQELRDQAEVLDPGTLYHLLQEAADRLEGLDERLGIVSETSETIEQEMNRIDAEILAADEAWRKLHRLNVVNLCVSSILLLLVFIIRLIW